jgi:hypothetical protein
MLSIFFYYILKRDRNGVINNRGRLGGGLIKRGRLGGG